MKPFQCRQCGNGRDLLPAICPFCGDAEPVEALAPYTKLDLDRAGLSSDEAISRFEDALRVAAEAGLKWLVVLHGYGSSGMGGKIGQRIRQGLRDNYWADRVWDSVECERIRTKEDLNETLSGERGDMFRSMERERLLGNRGATILVLRRIYP